VFHVMFNLGHALLLRLRRVSVLRTVARAVARVQRVSPSGAVPHAAYSAKWETQLPRYIISAQCGFNRGAHAGERAIRP
jgi:hypothetical protein